MVQRRSFHLCALACVFLAAKLEEETLIITFEQIRRYALPGLNVSDRDLARMERRLLLALDWQVGVVTPHSIIFALLQDLSPESGVWEAAVIVDLSAPFFFQIMTRTSIYARDRFAYGDRI